jgi:hypothetical protein
MSEDEIDIALTTAVGSARSAILDVLRKHGIEGELGADGTIYVDSGEGDTFYIGVNYAKCEE